MNILHLVPALEEGGVETGTVDLAFSLQRLGQTVLVVSRGGRLVRRLTERGVRHIELPVHRKSPAVLLTVPSVASILRRERIDIVHASSRIPAWVGYLSCRLTKTPFVTSCHGFYAKHFFSSVMGRGKLVMVISRSIEERMAKDFKVPEEKIRLVYRGVDLAQYSLHDDTYDEEHSSFVVINVGRLTPLKGHDAFIRAMKRVIDRIGSVEAWIVGGAEAHKREYVQTLHDLTYELGIEEKIQFLGHRDDVPDLLRKADCLVLSTNVPEGFGRTVIEAGATGTAVCASDIGGIKEIIENGTSGLLFPPGDEVAMADTILRMLGDVSLRRECAGNLRKRVEDTFTLERMAKETLAVYEEAIGR